jgi:hypothetical protein
MRRPRVTKAIRERLSDLLEMLYRPSEIAEVLGIGKDTLYTGWIPAGAPHTRDEKGHIWIVGTALAAWLREHDSADRVTGVNPGD